MKVLAVGDIVGEAGLSWFVSRIRALRKETGADFIAVNGENACGTGITGRQAGELLDAGADVITLGNHAFRRQEIFEELEDNPRILRPMNFAPQSPGQGWGEYETRFGTVQVINLIGRCNLDFGPDNPFLLVEKHLKNHPCRLTLVDFHAEATSEKLAMAYHLDGKVSALWGTHTHVQTSDGMVLPNGTGYLTDLGMTGPKYSVLGVEPQQSISMFRGDPRQNFKTAPGPRKLEGAVFTVDEKTGRCTAVQPLRLEEAGGK